MREGAQDSMAFPPPPWEAQHQDFSPTAESGSPFAPQMHQTQVSFTHAQPISNNNPYPQMPQTGQPVNNSPYSQMPQTGQTVINNSPYPQMPQAGSAMYMPNQPNQGLGPGYPPQQQQQQQQMMMAQFYAQQQQQQQQQQAYGNQMGGYGYGYNQQQQGSSPYLDQQMYGLSIRDQTSHQVPSSSSTTSYLPPMKPKNKPEDKLFGDLVDITKFKPTKPTSGRAGTM